MAYQVLDGTVFRDIVLGSWQYLSARKKEVDSLNVFPVPDGDTGTNMSLTLSSAAEYLSGKEGLSLYQAAEMASHGALMGARGNSGVILSQIFRGIAKYFSGKDTVLPMEFAGALDEAVTTAYKAVMKPVEGTILTVLRAMRDGALSVASAEASLAEVLQAGLDRGREMLARTPDMLPVLKQAGVVDAGGKGLVYVIEGALAALNGEGYQGHIALSDEQAGSEAVHHEQVRVEDLETADIRYPYDTQLLVSGESIPLSLLRQRLLELGDSLLVVGSEKLARVHIHTGRPGDVLTLSMEYGTISQVTVDNMVEQSREASESYLLSSNVVGGQVVPFSGQCMAPDAAPEKEVGIVGVATGEGLKEIMTSLGCDLVIDGGSTMNPSTAELAAAVKTVRAKKIIFLPNNSNIFLAAKQAKKLVGRNTLYIVASKTIPQGISALLSLNLTEDMTHNLKRAGKAIKRVKTGEVTFAARNGKFGRHNMKQGDILGLVDGKVEIVGQDPQAVLAAIVQRMVRPEDEVVTVYCGQEVSREVREGVLGRIREAAGDKVEIEVHQGGQPLYYYIVSVE